MLITGNVVSIKYICLLRQTFQNLSQKLIVVILFSLLLFSQIILIV